MGKDRQMDKRELQKIAQAAAKNIKTEDDLNGAYLSAILFRPKRF